MAGENIRGGERGQSSSFRQGKAFEQIIESKSGRRRPRTKGVGAGPSLRRRALDQRRTAERGDEKAGEFAIGFLKD